MTTDTIVRSHPYAGAADLDQLADFLTTSGGARPPHAYWHIGNLSWSMYYSSEYDPCRDVSIWKSPDECILGFAWFEEPDSVELQVAPQFRGTGSLEGPMLDWAAQHARALQPPGDCELRTTALDHDTEYIEILFAHGFQREQPEPSSVRMRQNLRRSIPSVTLPDGWTIRPVADESEWPERVDVHREVWHPSRMTLEAYRRLRSSPGYLPDLDLVAVAPDGTFASYCICWLDVVNGTGLFEPLGTRRAARRKGLSAAILTTALLQLQQLGVQTALVSTSLRSEPAIKLYESVGFVVDDTESRYRKRI